MAKVKDDDDGGAIGDELDDGDGDFGGGGAIGDELDDGDFGGGGPGGGGAIGDELDDDDAAFVSIHFVYMIHDSQITWGIFRTILQVVKLVGKCLRWARKMMTK